MTIVENTIIGSTNNLARRLIQHVHGHTWTTQRRINPKLVLSQEYPTLLEARQVELRIKRLKRKDYVEKMIADGYIKLR